MRPPTSALFLTAALYLTASCSANPLPRECYDCPPISKHGAENTFQEIHHNGLICFYSGMPAACSYDAATGDAWPDHPSECYPLALPTLCASHHTPLTAAQPKPAGHAGSIMGLMKGKMGNRLTEQQREEKARILADLLAGGSFGA